MGTIAPRPVVILLLAVALLAGSTTLAAQETKKQDEKKELPQDPIQVIPFERRDEGLNALAWVACMGSFSSANGAGWGVLGARVLASDESLPLVTWHFIFDEVFPIGQIYLDPIRDKRLLPDRRAKLFQELPAADQAFFRAYWRALLLSDRATMDMFDKSAQEYDKVVYTHLAQDPGLYRGKIITVKGKVTSVTWSPGPPSLEKDGIANVYTAGITVARKGVPPFTAVFTELPVELQGKDASELQTLDLEVTFKGYFLCHVRFLADKGSKKDVFSPYLVGKTLIVHPPRKDAENGPVGGGEKPFYAIEYIVYTVGSIVILALLVAVLNLYFRRGDRRIQAQIAEMRDKQQPFNIEPEEPTAENPGPGVEATPKVEEGFKLADRPEDAPPPAPP